MPTNEDDQGGHFFFKHPERGGYSAAKALSTVTAFQILIYTTSQNPDAGDPTPPS